MADNINEKKVLISVETNTDNANSQFNAIKANIEQTKNSAKDLDKLDYGAMSVKDLRSELEKAEQSMKDLADSGKSADGSLGDINNRVNDISTALKGIKGKESFDTFKGSVMSTTGAVEAMEGAMMALGIKSEGFEEVMIRIMGIRAFKDGIEDVFEYGKALKGAIPFLTGMTGATQGATIATKALRLGLASIGIGLIITALAYLIENFEEVKAVILDLFPELEGLGSWFSNIKPILMGVGKAVLDFVIAPFKTVISTISALLSGDFKKAADEFNKGLNNMVNPTQIYKNAVSSYKTGYADQITKENEKKNTKVVEADKKAANERVNTEKSANTKIVDERKKLADEVAKFVSEAEKEIANSTKTAQQIEIDSIREKYAERIRLATQAGVDTTTLLEAQRLAEKEVNDKYDLIAAEAAKKAAEEKVKAEEAGKRAALESANMTGDTNVTNAENAEYGSEAEKIDAVTASRLEALQRQYEAETNLYAGNEEKLANLKANYEKKKTDVNKQQSDARKAIDEAETRTKEENLGKVSATLGMASKALGEHTAVGKAAAIAQTTIDTYTSAVAAYKSMAGIPIVGPALGAVAAAAAIKMGLDNVKRIVSVKADNLRSSSNSSVQSPSAVQSEPAVSAPVINTTVLNRGEAEDLANPQQQTQQPLRAYIVNKDLQDASEKTTMIDKLSTF